jgi:hypothetical protein
MAISDDKFIEINHPRRKRRGISAESFCQSYRSKLRGIQPDLIKNPGDIHFKHRNNFA